MKFMRRDLSYTWGNFWQYYTI